MSFFSSCRTARRAEARPVRTSRTTQRATRLAPLALCSLTLSALTLGALTPAPPAQAQILPFPGLGTILQPPGGRIVFASDRLGGRELWSSNPDGSELMRLTNTDGANYQPNLSRDGRKIVFVSTRNGNDEGDGDIYTMNIDGSGVQQLTQSGDDESDPEWSPDGRHIVYERTISGGNHEIFLMHHDGTGQVNITNRAGFDADPTFSPDGRLILFSSGRQANISTQLYTMNLQGHNVRLVAQVHPHGTTQGALLLSPDWSPNGMQIACEGWFITGGTSPSSQTLNNPEILRFNFDGSNMQQLTNNGATFDEAPAFSPDGLRIAFSSNRDGDDDIYHMNYLGLDVRRTTNNTDDDNSPSWGTRVNILPLPATFLTAQGRNLLAPHVILSWVDNATNNDGYVIEVSTDGVHFERRAKIADLTGYIDTKVNGGHTYYYRVFAYNEAGRSGPSNTVEVHVPITPVTTSR